MRDKKRHSTKGSAGYDARKGGTRKGGYEVMEHGHKDVRGELCAGAKPGHGDGQG